MAMTTAIAKEDPPLKRPSGSKNREVLTMVFRGFQWIFHVYNRFLDGFWVVLNGFGKVFGALLVFFWCLFGGCCFFDGF